MSTFSIKTRIENLSQAQLTSLVLFAFMLGLLLRMAGLARSPMSVGEASYALRALDLAQSQPIFPLENAAYLALTSLSFFLFEASNFLARFWPALIGSSLVLLPLLWRKRLGNLATLILAVILALDPSLIQLSRQADSGIVAVAGLVWALSFLLHSKPGLAGASLALGLLGGPWFWIGVMAIALTGLTAHLLHINLDIVLGDTGLGQLWGLKSARRHFYLGFSIMLIISATAFLGYPAGLSGIMTGFTALFALLPADQKLPAWLPIYRLVARSLFTFVLAIVAIIPVWKQKHTRLQVFSLLSAFALLLNILFRSRGAGGLVLLILPLLVLASLSLERLFTLRMERTPLALGYFVFASAVLVYISLSAPRLINTSFTDPLSLRYGISVLAGLLLLGLTYVLVGMGWSYRVARQGLIAALLLVVSVGTLSHSFAGLDDRAWEEARLWSNSPSLLLSGDFDRTAAEIQVQSGFPLENASVVLLGDGLEAFAWPLRAFSDSSYSSGLGRTARPDFILDNANQSMDLSDAYRGRDMLATGQIDWWGMPVADLVRSLVTSTPKLKSSTITVWIRADLFTGVQP